ncbi:hypothetical protein PVL29_004486 [Vitis rotundifolia]|uniref:Uncharacterized protein n=1 Tax=Vitis rotundifolia TaxID=103349 RepID=A0AA39E133_VITRO|nr:hypothetical protein PVL29_004486 [Vitis rotundifolia]
MSTCVCCCRPAILGKSKEGVSNGVVLKPPGSISSSRSMNSRVFGVRASMVDSYESSSNFAKRMEQAWLISQQPRPVSCTSCETKGHVECKWCRGTGFFILGDNMLCQVPSRNTSCVICAGKVGLKSTYPSIYTCNLVLCNFLCSL